MDVSRYRTASFNYADVGATKNTFPARYHHVTESRVIGSGLKDFVAAADALMQWDMHRGAGLKVHSSEKSAVPDAVVVLTLGPIRIPCRVVYVIDEANRQGFAYGTLDGHPESGEELFHVDYSPADGTVTAHIAAFSSPGRWYTRLGGPVGRRVQSLFTDRYLTALAAVCRSPQ
ncbi:hypothetical protein CH275_03210 [Rhodococcus sp. 06-235-1A]|uniref:DUF1990 family protein n=1 Tax=Rhodococcus sp. 06-235-1A TaxID=2022508 RepID=UPI000B9C6C10|nr:DUF1990 domain-containing protein [Rhodococcus sp. 06-235-1A]OZD09434.1 hypothetical protein CH275_03210 [Rhodococcus sp. 06-235-1A]